MATAMTAANAHGRERLDNVHPTAWCDPQPAGRHGLVVIGGGTAGLVAAHAAAVLGAKVALIERGRLGGDACLEHKFTHTADASARIVVQNALFLGRRRLSALTIPRCTYTVPEIAHGGLYVRQAREMFNEITLAMVAGIGLRTLARVIHAYPTQAAAIRKTADAYDRTRLTPAIRLLLRRWLQW